MSFKMNETLKHLTFRFKKFFRKPYKDNFIIFIIIFNIIVIDLKRSLFFELYIFFIFLFLLLVNIFCVYYIYIFICSSLFL